MAITDRNLSVATQLHAKYKGVTYRAEVVPNPNATATGPSRTGSSARTSCSRALRRPVRRSPRRPATGGPSGRWASRPSTQSQAHD